MKSLESLLSEEEHKSIKLQNNLDKMEEKSAADRFKFSSMLSYH